MVQTFRLFLILLPIAVVVPFVQLLQVTGAVQSMNVAVLAQRQVPMALCAGWAPGPFINLSVGSV